MSCNRFTTILVRSIVVLGLLLTAGCGGNPFHTIERSIRAELPRLIGPADQYDVKISRSSGGLVSGRIPWIEIRGRNVHTIPELNLDELAVRLEGVRFNRSERSVREIERSSFEARIAAASVAKFVQARSPSLRAVRIRFAGDQVIVDADPALLGIGVPVEIEGRPVLHGPTTIDFQASRVAVLRLGLPSFALRRLESRVNPLIDLSSLRFPLRLTSIRIDGDRAVVSGAAELTPGQLRPK